MRGRAPAILEERVVGHAVLREEAGTHTANGHAARKLFADEAVQTAEADVTQRRADCALVPVEVPARARQKASAAKDVANIHTPLERVFAVDPRDVISGLICVCRRALREVAIRPDV